MNRYYVLSEDDPEQAASIKDAIKRESGVTDVRVFHTELSARDFIDKLAKSPADQKSLIGWIGDGMMLWDYPQREPRQPDKAAKREGPVRAGERLRKQLRKHKQLQRIPWIVYSAIQPSTIGYSANDKDPLNEFLPKTSSVKAVITKIDELRSRAESMKDDDFDDSEWPDSDDSETNFVRADPELHKSIIKGLKERWSDCEVVPLSSLRTKHA